MEKTEGGAGKGATVEKHLHGRGEDRRTFVTSLLDLGNTSTDVEKTVSWRHARALLGKHLHGRGEDRELSLQHRR